MLIGALKRLVSERLFGLLNFGDAAKAYQEELPGYQEYLPVSVPLGPLHLELFTFESGRGMFSSHRSFVITSIMKRSGLGRKLPARLQLRTTL